MSLNSIEREFNQDNIVDAFSAEEAARERLALQELRAKTLAELASDMGAIDAGIFRSWTNEGILRMIRSGEDLFEILGFHAHDVSFDDNGDPQYWVDAENGEIAIAGGAGRLGKLGILMNGLRYAIQQTAANLLGENVRIGRLEMFLPAGSDVPAWGMTFSDQVEPLIANGDFETGDLTGWNTDDPDYFEVVADAKLDGAYGLHVKDVESGTKTIASNLFQVIPGVNYNLKMKINEFLYKSLEQVICPAEFAVSINSDNYSYPLDGHQTMRMGIYTGQTRIHRVFVKFDLSAINPLAVIDQSLMRYYIYSRPSSGLLGARSLRLPTKSVTEEMNWQTYDGENSWSTAGDGGDSDSTFIENRNIYGGNSGVWAFDTNIDETMVKNWTDGSVANNGFMWRFSSSTEVAGALVIYGRGSTYDPYLDLQISQASSYEVKINYYDDASKTTLISSTTICDNTDSIITREILMSVVPPSGASYAELVIEASQGVGFYVDSISIESFKSIHFTDRGVSVEGNFLVNGSAKTVTDRFYNKSGGAVAEGDAVILDNANERAFKTTTTPGSFAALGIAKETIASDALGALATTSGEVAIVNCDSTAVSIGDYLKTSATSKLATSNGKVMTPNCFAKALSAKASGSTGTVYCMILDHNPVVATPAEINNLVLWLRPESLVGYSEGALLSQWTDESVSANHPVITTDGYKPKVRKSVVSGLDVVEFDGVDDRLISPAVCFSGAGQRTMIAVYKSLQTTAPQYICGQSNISTSYSAYHLLSSSSEGDPIVVTRNLNVTTPFIVSSSWKIGCGDYDGSTIRVFRNNMLGNSQSLSLVTVSTGGFRLANYYPGSSGQYGNAQIAEVIVYDRCLTDNERGAVHEYLSNKYGITLS